MSDTMHDDFQPQVRPPDPKFFSAIHMFYPCILAIDGILLYVGVAAISRHEFGVHKPRDFALKAHSLKIALFLYVAPLHKSTSYRGEPQMIAQ